MFGLQTREGDISQASFLDPRSWSLAAKVGMCFRGEGAQHVEHDGFLNTHLTPVWR